MENLSTDIHKSFGRSLFNKRARYLTEHYSCVPPTIKRYSLQSRFCHSTGDDSLNAGLSLPVLQKHDCRKDCKLKSKMKKKKNNSSYLMKILPYLCLQDLSLIGCYLF